jgi:hypothetical protein
MNEHIEIERAGMYTEGYSDALKDWQTQILMLLEDTERKFGHMHDGFGKSMYEHLRCQMSKLYNERTAG